MSARTDYIADRARAKREDPRNVTIVSERMDTIDALDVPRVGDWVTFGNGEARRFSYSWGDALQTADPPGDSGSFYLGKYGCSFSGGLDPSVPVSTLTRTDETRDGRVWIFDHDHAGAGRAVTYSVPFRVYASSLREAPR